MTKQELLTRLAMECATWKESVSAVESIACAHWKSGVSYGITLQDWLAERERLINKPSWEDAPEGATHLALDGTIPGVSSCASWYFYIGEPAAGNHLWLPIRGSEVAGLQGAREAIAIPAGYDWKQSLEERPV